MNDTINRQDALDALIPIVKSASLRNRNVYSVARKCLGAIEDVPSAERKGKWIEHHEPYTWMGYTYWTCSECACECGHGKEIPNRTNYCYNCGARMVNE